MLAADAQDEEKQFSSWMAETHWPQLSDQVCGFQQRNLVSIFAGMWAQYGELKKSAKETRAHPGSTETVALAKHDFTYNTAPQVDVLINRVKVATISFQIGLTCAVSGLELFLKQGAVYRITSGSCDIKAQISCAGQLILERTVRKLDLPGELQLSKPIVLDEVKTREPALMEE
jgi:hypothetical protein